MINNINNDNNFNNIILVVSLLIIFPKVIQNLKDKGYHILQIF